MDENESPYLLLNWLQSGSEDMQLSALEQLCLALLQHENNETLVKLYPPSTYVPILACFCQDFDISQSLLEAAIRTLTYYMQAVPHEVINRLVNSKGSLLAICMHLENPNMTNTIENDLTQQIIKLCEELCKRDTKSLSSIGGASYIINFMSKYNDIIHLDTIKSGFYVLYKIIDKIDPHDKRLCNWVGFLSKFLRNSDGRIVEYSLHCLLSIIKICNDKKVSTDKLGIEKIIDSLLDMTLAQIKSDREMMDSSDERDSSINWSMTSQKIGLSRVVIDLILCTIRSSTHFLCNLLINNKLINILHEIIQHYEQASWSIIQLIEGMFDQITDRINYSSNDQSNCVINNGGGGGINSTQRTNAGGYNGSQTQFNCRIINARIYNEDMMHQYSKYHNCLMRSIIYRNLDILKDLLLSTDFDPKYKDRYGQTPLNWACASGFTEAINLLVARGMDFNYGDRATCLHYAVMHGHANIVDQIIKIQSVDLNIRDYKGRTVIQCLKESIDKYSEETNEYFRELLENLENHEKNVKEQILEAKKHFLRRMIPLLINVYLQNYKSNIRLHILELIHKVFLSFTIEDHEIFQNEQYDNYPLAFHIAKLIYRVLLQDTGENVLEVLRICKTLTNKNIMTDQYIISFQRMDIDDLLKNNMNKFITEDIKFSFWNDDIYKIIPLDKDKRFSAKHGSSISSFHQLSLIPSQMYYWGDWNIIILSDSVNIFNDYLYAQILLNNKDYLTVSFLCRKDPDLSINDNSLEFNNIATVNYTKPYNDAATRKINCSQNIYNLIKNASNISTFPNFNIDNNRAQYYGTTVKNKIVTFETKENIEKLFDLYTNLNMRNKIMSLPMSFPKLTLGRFIYYENLEITSVSNHLRIGLIADTKKENETIDKEYVEMSFNKVTGIHMKTSNQSIYKTGPLNAKSGIIKLGVSKSVSECLRKKLTKSNVLWRQTICQRIMDYRNEILNILKSQNSIETPIMTLTNNISEFLSQEPKLVESNIEFVVKKLENLLIDTKIRPTPIEIYKSGFIEQFIQFLQKYPKQLEIIVKDHTPILANLLIQTFELLENLPTSYQNHSLIADHYLTRPLQMKAVLCNCQQPHSNSADFTDLDSIPDLSKYTFLIMPLTSPMEITNKFVNLIQKLPWYRASKNELNSIRRLKTTPNMVELSLNTVFKDENEAYKGVFYWLGTNGLTSNRFMNSMKLELVNVSLSENFNMTSFNNITNNLSCILNPIIHQKPSSPISKPIPSNKKKMTAKFMSDKQVHSSVRESSPDPIKSYISVFGFNCYLNIIFKQPISLIPTHYCLVRPNDPEVADFCLTNWKLMASNNGIDWDILSIHENDNSLKSSPTGCFTWSLNIADETISKLDGTGWTIFRIQIIPKFDSSTHQQSPPSPPSSPSPIPSPHHQQTSSTTTSQSNINFTTQKINYDKYESNGFYLASIEFFGKVIYYPETKVESIKQHCNAYLNKFKVGALVQPGPDWCIENSRNFKYGRIISALRNGYLLVDWLVKSSRPSSTIPSEGTQLKHNDADIIDDIDDVDENVDNDGGVSYNDHVHKYHHRHIRHKMKTWNELDAGKYELALIYNPVSDIQIDDDIDKSNINSYHEQHPDNPITADQEMLNRIISIESFVDTRSSLELQQHESHDEDGKNSLQDSFSWILDHNVSTPIRTSSLSSQRNSRFTSYSNKENWIDNSFVLNSPVAIKQSTASIGSINNKEAVGCIKQNIELDKCNLKFPEPTQEELEFMDDNIKFVKSETDDNLEIHEDNLLLEENKPIVLETNPLSKFENLYNASSTSKSILQYENKSYDKLDELSDIKPNYGKEDFKKNFSLTKQTKRRNYTKIDIIDENKNIEPINNENRIEDIDICEDNEEFDECSISPHPIKYSFVDKRKSNNTKKYSQAHVTNVSSINGTHSKSNKNQKFKTKLSTNFTSPGFVSSDSHYPHPHHHHHSHQSNIAATSKFKPIQIDHSFPGLIQAIDNKTTGTIVMQPSKIKSNIENFDYNQPNMDSKDKPGTSNELGITSKNFGYKPEHFVMKLEIQRRKSTRAFMGYPRLIADNTDFINVAEQLMRDSLDSNIGFENKYSKLTNTFNLESDGQYPIADHILSLMPPMDHILNMYPIDNVSDTWQSQLTLYYGFCSKSDTDNGEFCCDNCQYKDTSKVNSNEDNSKLEHISELKRILDLLGIIKTKYDQIQKLNEITIKQFENVNKPSIFSLCTKDTIESESIQHQGLLGTHFISQSICHKSLSQLEDVWTLMSRQQIPSWIINWPLNYQFLYSFNIRVHILQSYWFGISRSVFWLQYHSHSNKSSSTPNLLQISSHTTQANTFAHNLSFGRHHQDDSIVTSPLLHLGRLRKHIVRIPRPISGDLDDEESCQKSRNDFWTCVTALLTAHAHRREQLEVQFIGEEGTGLGPTLEFVSTLSLEFQRGSLGMWINCQNNDMSKSYNENDDEYVHVKNGLFPAPWPADMIPKEIVEKFHLLGIFMAKCLLDGHRMDIPFSDVFLRLLSQPNIPDYDEDQYLSDFCVIYPERGAFLTQLAQYCSKKQELISNLARTNSHSLCNLESSLQLLSKQIIGSTFDDICIDMEFLPTSLRNCAKSQRLLDQYPWEENCDSSDDLNCWNNYDAFHEAVTEYNCDKYLRRTLLYSLNKGIKKQIEAVKDGFNKVFPIDSLSLFSCESSTTNPSSELRQLLCGQQLITWSLDDLKQFTEPTQGYNRQSSSYQLLLAVLFGMSQPERRLFIQFVTGCPSLPPGGLSALTPRLTVVKKSGRDCGPYPSVNTCMHYLKLPEYNSEQELRTRLLEACRQVGFYLN